MTLGIANGGVNTLQVADSAVTAMQNRIGASGQEDHGLSDNVTLAAGAEPDDHPVGQYA